MGNDNKGALLKRLRQEKHLTQEDVGKRLGVSKQTLYKYENNIITNIPSDKLEILAALYGVEPAYILGWDKQPTPPPAAPTTNDLAQLARDGVARAFVQMLCKDNPEALAIISRMQVTATGELNFPDLSDASQAVINSHLQAMIAALQKATDNGDGTKTATWKPNK